MRRVVWKWISLIFDLYERVTFFGDLSGDSIRLIAKKAKAKEIEDTGVWIEFEGEDSESFVTFPDMQLFIRAGSTTLEGTQALAVNQLTAAQFGNAIKKQ